jgi:LPXTG-motif cell wall-anchored protein
MRQSRRSRLALVSAAAGVACLAFATPAWATATTSLKQSNVPMLAPGGDPAGANGTVKIDNVPVDNNDGPDIRNHPHVGCDFAVSFFNFDADQHANIIFTVQQPSGSGAELLRRDNVLVSTDPAGGGKPDPDEVFTFSASQLGLDAYKLQSQQGYHVKLTVEIIGAPGAGKHKVFWVQSCAQNTPSSPPPSSPSSPPPSSPSNGGGVAGGGGSLPITGASVGGLVALGLGLVGTGVTFLVLRRRRQTVEFEA